MKFNKGIVVACMALVMGCYVVGCAKSTPVTLHVNGIGSYEVVNLPEGFMNYSVENDNIHFSVKDDGDYTVVVKGEDGKEHEIKVNYQNGKLTVNGGDVSVIAGIDK